jgi:hypothetical protein
LYILRGFEILYHPEVLKENTKDIVIKTTFDDSEKVLSVAVWR